MPSSHLYQLNEITELMLTTAPQSLLDVGVGFGKFGVLGREYLELWDGRKDYSSWQRRIDGIEVFPDYLTPLHDYIYDRIYIGDALDILPTLAQKPEDRYDLVLLIDILEHFDEAEGIRFLRQSLRVGRNVIVSTPLDIGRQGSAFGNVHETHRFQWRAEHLRGYGPHFFVPNSRSIIWYCGEDAARVEVERPSVAPPKPKAVKKPPVRASRPSLHLRVRRRLGRVPALHAVFAGARSVFRGGPPAPPEGPGGTVS